VAAARKAGVTNAMMVGGHEFGLQGQILSFYAEDKTHFVSAFSERHQPSAQGAEADPNVALVCEKSKTPKVRCALEELGVTYELVKDSYSLLRKLEVPHADRASVLPSEMQITLDGPAEGEAGYLADRVLDTQVRASADDDTTIVIDLGREREIDSIWMMDPGSYGIGLPESYELTFSTNGVDYQEYERRCRARQSVAYICGNQAYMKGYRGWFEARFNDLRCQYLRLRVRAGHGRGPKWRVGEIFVFEKRGDAPPVADNEVQGIAWLLKDREVTFTMCDRWLSARLMGILPTADGTFPVYPRLNPKYPVTVLSRRLRPKKGTALAVDVAVQAECDTLLKEVYGDAVTWTVVDFPRYALFLFNETGDLSPGAELEWAGATLLKRSGPEETHD
jgi:hypothetical protein